VIDVGSLICERQWARVDLLVEAGLILGGWHDDGDVVFKYFEVSFDSRPRQILFDV
jgi:hypothetical protein